MLHFELSDVQMGKLKTWQETHPCKYRKPGFGRYVGTFGGADTFLFTPLSVGTVIVQVHCACGAELDLTEGSVLD